MWLFISSIFIERIWNVKSELGDWSCLRRPLCYMCSFISRILFIILCKHLKPVFKKLCQFIFTVNHHPLLPHSIYGLSSFRYDYSGCRWIYLASVFFRENAPRELCFSTFLWIFVSFRFWSLRDNFFFTFRIEATLHLHAISFVPVYFQTAKTPMINPVCWSLWVKHLLVLTIPMSWLCWYLYVGFWRYPKKVID